LTKIRTANSEIQSLGRAKIPSPQPPPSAVKVENDVNQNPTIETLTKIAKALEVGVDDLMK